MRISDWSSDVCSSDLRHAGTAGRREFHHLPEVGHRQDARHDRHGDAGRTGAVEEAEIDIGVEEILGDAARGAGIDLALEMLEFDARRAAVRRSEEHTSELKSLMRISYAVFCLKKKSVNLQ